VSGTWSKINVAAIAIDPTRSNDAHAGRRRGRCGGPLVKVFESDASLNSFGKMGVSSFL
jgi:hypothetical protein